MAEFIKASISTVATKMGDGFLYALDEAKFWGEVVAEFFELDGKAGDRHLSEVRQQIRD